MNFIKLTCSCVSSCATQKNEMRIITFLLTSYGNIEKWDITDISRDSYISSLEKFRVRSIERLSFEHW